MIETTLNKQIPLKPKAVRLRDHLKKGYKLGDCPVCGRTVDSDENYCATCGQRLDWRVE
jgi:predicted amidophosphoribosyltransferase